MSDRPSPPPRRNSKQAIAAYHEASSEAEKDLEAARLVNARIDKIAELVGIRTTPPPPERPTPLVPDARREPEEDERVELSIPIDVVDVEATERVAGKKKEGT